MLKNLWLDQSGGIISTELVLVASLVAAGILGGMSKFSRNISDEFTELGTVVSSRSIGFDSVSNHRARPEELTGTEYYLFDESLLRTDDSARRDELPD